MANIKVACVVLICMAVVAAPVAQAAITCGQVVGPVAQCAGYLRSGGNPPPGCCNGVKNLVKLAQTTADKKTACNCLKSAVGAVPGYNDGNAVSLAGKCGVNVPYKISTSTNCNTIQF